MKNALIFAIVVTIAGVSGFVLQRYLATYKTDSVVADPIIGKTRPDFAMKDLEGDVRNISEWDGKVLLVNFWATWCPPCMREIPLLVELQEKYAAQGFQIIGVAIDDIDAINSFADDMGINYPILPGELEAIKLSRQYGNRIDGLPYTAFVNRQGKISHVIAGELHKEKADRILKELGINTSL